MKTRGARKARGAADGPFDGDAWPTTLTARAVAPAPDPAVFGYRLFDDLLAHYDFLHVAWLMLTGELASDASRALFESSLGAIAAVRVSEGPSHAGLLAKTCDAKPGQVVATTAVVCAEEAQHVVDIHAEWLAHVRNAKRAPIPAAWRASSKSPLTTYLQSACKRAGVNLPWLGRVEDRAAVLGCLTVAGLVRDDQLVTAWVFGRLIGANAEALATEPRLFKNYPVNLPPLRYEEAPSPARR